MKYFKEPYDGKTIEVSRDDASVEIMKTKGVDRDAAEAMLEATTIDDPIEVGDDCIWCEDG